jgi:pimeloyl-ACP methyl ester carboxylesterase
MNVFPTFAKNVKGGAAVHLVAGIETRSDPIASQWQMKTIRTEVLEIAYFDNGPKEGPPVLLLHGWPESPAGFDRVCSRLHEAGFRTIAPFLRGFGETHFLSSATPRVSGAAALAQDALDFMDGIGIQRFYVVGHDWGARTGYALAALAPERLSSLCALSLAFQPRFQFRTPFTNSRAASGTSSSCAATKERNA